MLYNEEKCYRIPKQLNSKLETTENVPIVTPQTAIKMNEEYRHNCEIHDINDRDSWISADTIYVEA